MNLISSQVLTQKFLANFKNINYEAKNVSIYLKRGPLMSFLDHSILADVNFKKIKKLSTF